MRQGNVAMSAQYRKTEGGKRRPSPQSSGAPRRQDKKGRPTKRNISRKRGILLALFAVLAITVILLLSPIFSISKIHVSAVSLYSGEEIASAFQTLNGKNGLVSLLRNTSFSNLDDLFRLRFGRKEKSMLFDYPLIKNIVIKYDLPDTITVAIEERTPIMVTESNGMYLYLDSEGYLLGAYTQADKPDMPVIKGIEIAEYKIGTSIAGGKDRTVDDAIKICNIMKQLSMLSYIDIIDVSDYNNIWMYCAPSLSIKFGSADDIGRKLSYIKGIIDSGHDGASNGTLDMSTGGNPIFRGNDSTQGSSGNPQGPEAGE